MLLLALLACSGTKETPAPDDSATDSAAPIDSGDSADSAVDTEPLPPDCTGIEDLGAGKFFLEVDGSSFWVLVPAEAGDCAPVFIFGHGGSSPGGADTQGNWRDTGTGLAALAPQAGFILVVPFLEDSPSTQHVWQESDAEVLDAMVASVASQWDIDRNRVLFAGTSAGGHMASFYGLYRPQVPKAIAVLSAGLGGYFDYPETAPETLLPFYVAHDPDDEIVPYSYSEHLAEQLELHGHEYVFEDLDLEGNGHFTDESVWLRVVEWWMERG